MMMLYDDYVLSTKEKRFLKKTKKYYNILVDSECEVVVYLSGVCREDW